MTLVSGTLHGYEIKSDRDSLRRLARQVALYSAVLGLTREEYENGVVQNELLPFVKIHAVPREFISFLRARARSLGR